MDLRIYLDRVREILNAQGTNAVLTVGDLTAAGLIQYSNGTIGAIIQQENYGTPPAPTNVSVSGALASIIVTCSLPNYPGHAYTEIWAAPERTGGGAPTIGDAELVGMTAGSVFSHVLGSGATRWYWVRFVNRNSVAGAYNAVEGIQAATSEDPAYLLDLLTGQLTESQLYQTLGERIDLIDADASVTGSVAARIASEAQTRASEIAAEAQARANAIAAEAAARGTAITNEETARQNADNALAQSITTLTSTVGSNTSAIQAEQTARTNADTALATDITALDSRLTTAEGGVTGNSSAITSLDARVTTAEGGITANSTDITALDSRLTTAEGGVTGNSSAITSLDTRVTSVEGTVTAQATSISTLSASVGNNTAAIQTEATARASADGELQAQYTVKVESNGYVAGFGLASTAVDAVPTSEFIVRSDKFAIASPSGPGIAPSEPFIVLTTATTINGVSVPAGVYIKDGFIQNGTITNAKIGNAAIDAAKISDASITTAKIAGAAITSALIEDGSITNAKIALAAVGTATIEDAAITNAKIGDAEITTAKIADAQITSAKIADASIGIAKIDTAGITSLSALSATIGTFQSASSGARLVISDDKLEVYDANNVLRVKLGNLV
jgi:hypothetical protein